MNGFADGLRAVVEQVQPHRAGQLRLQLRQLLADGVHHRHGVGVALAHHRQHDGALAVDPAAGLEVFHAVFHRGHVGQPHWQAVAAGDHQIGELGGVLQLAVGFHRHQLRFALQRAHRGVDVGGADAGGHVVQRQIARGQLARIGLDPHRETLLAEDVDLGHALEGGDIGRDPVLGVVVEIGQRHRRRIERQQQHRRIRRVDLAVGRHRGHFRRQRALRAQQRRLYVHRRQVDIAVVVELQRDGGASQGTGRADHRDAGNGGKLLLQRRGHRGGHAVRAGAGQAGGDVDGGGVEAGQRGDRQFLIGDQAGHHQRQAQQHRHHRTADAEFGDLHHWPPLAGPALAGRTLSPGRRLRPPLDTTASPTLSPLTTALSLWMASSSTDTRLTLPSACTA